LTDVRRLHRRALSRSERHGLSCPNTRLSVFSWRDSLYWLVFWPMMDLDLYCTSLMGDGVCPCQGMRRSTEGWEGARGERRGALVTGEAHHENGRMTVVCRFEDVNDNAETGFSRHVRSKHGSCLREWVLVKFIGEYVAQVVFVDLDVQDGHERGQPTTGSNGCSVRIRGSPPAGSEREGSDEDGRDCGQWACDAPKIMQSIRAKR
jgi:hypothetical protein